MKRMVVVHKLNNYSGSPNICRLAVRVFLNLNFEVILYTATPDGRGFLTDIEGVVNRPFFYKWSKYKLVTLLFYVWSEISVFFQLVTSLNKEDIVYVSTILPASAALAGKIRGCRVICHIHETAVSPKQLHVFLVSIIRICVSEVWYVSEYTAAAYSQTIRKPSHVVYNTLSADFFNQATKIEYAKKDSAFVVLMLSSYKVYKGIEVFVNLANRLRNVRFVLVLSTSEEEVALFCKAVKCPTNCEVLPARELPITLFSRAHLVVNLSLPHLFIETFGLTLLESMACGRPVIAPPVGGPAEFVKSGVNGFAIDSRQIEQLENQIIEISADYNSYLVTAKNARLTAENYSFGKFSAKIKDLIES